MAKQVYIENEYLQSSETLAVCMDQHIIFEQLFLVTLVKKVAKN